MKRVVFNPLIMAATFVIGFTAVSVWFFVASPHQKTFQEPENIVSAPKAAQNSIDSTSQIENEKPEYINPLETVWIEQNQITHNGYEIKRNCLPDNDRYELCGLKVSRNGKVFAQFNGENRQWLHFGFFPFLGEKDKQLVIETYSGGAHCCSNYYIYDLQPQFRIVFDGGKFDGGSEIGNDLIPIDIDGNGIYEFSQSVMAFDYFWASHAGSVFPPVVFEYDGKKAKYIIANEKYSDFILNELQNNLKNLPEWFAENEKASGYKIDNEPRHRMFVLETFLYYVYAGKEKDGWKFFEQNYNYETKEKLKAELKKQLADDLTYRAIYNAKKSVLK